MTTYQGDPRVFLILGAVFLALAIYLLVIKKKNTSVFRKFATSHGMIFYRNDTQSIENEINALFGRETKELVRSFSGIRNIITDGKITIFSCRELVDRNLRSAKIDTHSRIVAFFSIKHDIETSFRVVGPKVYPDYTSGTSIESSIAKILMERGDSQYAVSFASSKGKAILYFEPKIEGIANEKMLEDLYNLAQEVIQLKQP